MRKKDRSGNSFRQWLNIVLHTLQNFMAIQFDIDVPSSLIQVLKQIIKEDIIQYIQSLTSRNPNKPLRKIPHSRSYSNVQITFPIHSPLTKARQNYSKIRILVKLLNIFPSLHQLYQPNLKQIVDNTYI